MALAFAPLLDSKRAKFSADGKGTDSLFRIVVVGKNPSIS